MGFPRTFDWDEAARLRAAGMTYPELMERFGKSYHGLRYALDAEFRQRTQANKAEWQRAGSCPDCGAQTTRHRRDEPNRCCGCAAKRRHTVRGDEAWCPGCHEWLLLSAFTRSSKARGIRSLCRMCDGAQRRAYREAHPDVEAAALERRRARRREQRAALR